MRFKISELGRGAKVYWYDSAFQQNTNQCVRFVVICAHLDDARLSSSRNSDLDLNTSLDVDNDLLDDLGRCIEIDQSLVDSHLVHIPGLRTLTTRGLSRRNLQQATISLPASMLIPYISPPYLENLGRQSHWSLDTQLLALSTLQQFRADLLQRLDLA